MGPRRELCLEAVPATQVAGCVYDELGASHIVEGRVTM
jgi:hypothetical protein